jgi:hypothetical protein
MKENWKEFIKGAREEYNRMRLVSSLIFDNEKIYFNNHGFNHLIRKGRKLRDHKEIMERLKLLPYVIPILKGTKNTYQYKIDTEGKSIAHFWEIREQISSKRKKITVCVILRKLNEGRLHFFSVFNKQ